MSDNKGKEDLTIKDPYLSDAKPISLQNEALGVSGPVTFNYDSDFGSSQYDDKNLNPLYIQNKEYIESRAQSQDNWDKAGNAVGRFAGRAITSGLELGGNIYGLGKLGIELQLDPLNRQKYLQDNGTMEGYKEPTWATIFDNEVTRGLDSVDALVKKHLPQYASKDYKNASWYEKMGYANFYFDGLADAAGFAVGSTLGAVGYAKLTGNMFKMAKAGQVAELDAFIAEAKALTEAGKYASSVAKKIQATSDKIKAVDWTDKAFQMTVSGTAESGQEARSTGDGVRYKLTHDDFGNELELSDADKAKVEELVDQSMKSSYMMNLAVTGPASMLVNNAAIKKLSGVKSSAMDAGMVKPRLDYSPLETYVAKKAQSKFVSGAKNAGKILQNNSIEAIQEMYQHGTQSGITDYYQAKFDGKEGFDQILKSLSVGTEAAFSDEGLTAALMGFLTPGVSNTLTTGGGNIKDAFAKLSAQQKADVHFAALLNKNKSNDAFKALYEASTRHQEFSNQLDNAIENADDFETKNQMHNIMTNLVLSRIEAGRFEDLQKDLNAFKSMPAEKFEEAFGVKLDATKMETASSFIQSKIDAANEIKATNNDIETIFGNIVSPANKKRLVHATLAIKDSKKRSSDIVKEIHKTVSDTYMNSNESDFRTHTSVLNQNYHQLDEEGKLAYRNMILASELTPSDQKKVMDKLNDIDKLRGRTKTYTDLYTELTNPETQQIKDTEDVKAEAKTEAEVLNPTTTSEPPEAYSEEDQWGNTGDLSDEERMAEANAAREAAENSKAEESNTETEQSGVVETGLTVDDLEAEKSDEELESDLAFRQEQEENSTTTENAPEDLEGFESTEETAPVVTPKPTGMPAGTGHAKVLLTEGKAITESATRKIINAIKKFIGKNADINNHIILKAVPRGEHVNVQIMLNGKHVGNLNNKEIYKGSDNALNDYIRGIVLANPGKEFTPKDLGIYFGITDGSLDIVPSGVELTPVTDLINNGADISLTGGQVLIYDFHSRRDGKYNGGSFLGNVDSSLFKPGVDINPKAIPSTLGRYVMVIPMPNGSIKYVRVRPSSLESIDDKSVNSIFVALRDKAKAVKDQLNSVDLTELDKFNDDLNKDFFIAINKRADNKTEGLVFDGIAYDGYNITLEVEPRFGKIRATLSGVLGGEARDLTKVFIAASSNIGSMDALLASINKELGNGISITRQDFKASIPEKTDGKKAAKLMVAATTASVVKNQSLVFRRANKEETNAVSNLVEEAKVEEVKTPAPVQSINNKEEYKEIEKTFRNNKGTYQSPKTPANKKYSDYSSKGWKIHVQFGLKDAERVAKFLLDNNLYFKVQNDIASYTNTMTNAGATIYVGGAKNTLSIIDLLKSELSDTIVNNKNSNTVDLLDGGKPIYSGSGSDISMSEGIAVRFDVQKSDFGTLRGNKKYESYGFASYLGQFSGISFLSKDAEEIRSLESILESKNTQEAKQDAVDKIIKLHEESLEELEKDFGKEFIGLEKIIKARDKQVADTKSPLPKKKTRTPRKPKTEVVIPKSLDDQIEAMKALLDSTKDPRARRELKKQYNTLLAQLPKGGDAYRMSNEEGDSLTEEEIEDIKSMLPSFISIDDIDNILENLKANGMPMGVFRDKIIYLNSQKATKGTAYHEAFHAVFRTVLKESEIIRYLAEAKKEYMAKNNLVKLKEDIDKLRSYSDAYAGLSMQELENLVYEEYMADKFMEFKNDSNEKGFFRRLYIMIKNLFKFMQYHSEELESLYSSISNKAFVNSDLRDNRYTKLDGLGTPVFKLIPAGIEFRINEETGKQESYIVNHDQRKSEQMVGTLAAKIAKAMDGKYDNIPDDVETEDELFDYFVAERHKELNDDFDAYYDSIVATNPKLAEDISILAERERSTYEDADSLAVLKEMVDKRLSIFSHSEIEEYNEADLELNDNGETAEVAEKFGSTDSWLTGGHDSLPKLIKQYISFSTYMQFDEVLGKEVEVSVNPVVAYNGLTRIMADTPRSNMLTKLYHNSKYNPNIRAVLDRLMSDTGIVFNADGVASQPQHNHNDLQLFLNTFDNSVTKQLFTLVAKDGTYQVSNANKNDAKKVTVNQWANSIQWLLNRGGLTNAQLAERMSTIKFNIWDKGFNSKMTAKQLDAKVNELYEAFVSTGIKLSKGYIEYSLLADKKAKDITLSATQLQLIELNKDILPLDITLFAGEGTFRGLAAMVTDKENLFSKETGKGAYDRLEKVAEANGIFDETIGNASFKNAEGKSVYEIIKASYVLSEAKKLNDKNYRDKLKSGEDKNNDLNDRNYKFISKNYLLNKFENVISNLKINIIDGLRKEAEFEESEGAVFGKYDARTYLIQGLAFFATRSKDNTTKYIFRQNEASNTAYVAELPVQKLSENGKPNSVVIDAFYDKFKTEFDRIAREDATKDSSVKYKDYNTEDGRAFTFSKFAYIKDFNENLYDQLVRLALDGKVDDIPVDKVKDVITDYLEEGIDLYRDNLEKQGIIRVGADNSILNVYMPGVLAYEAKDAEEKKRYQSFDEAVAEFYLNDYLMSDSLNELMDGDYAISRKDNNDIVKRHKGAMGSGNNYGTGTHKVAYIKDINKFVVNTPEDGNLIRIVEVVGDVYKGSNGKEYTKEQVSKVTTNDAQSYQSMVHKVYSLYALGKLDPKTWEIYKKIIRNERISDKEQAHLEKNKASLNPDKTVTFGMGIYHKTSEHTIVRSMVSYVGYKNQRKFKELNEQLINLLEQRDFDSKKITAITKKIAKLYEAKPGMTYLHNLANQMDMHGIDQVITESASKGATLVPVDSMSEGFDLSTASTDVLNEYKRLQVETPTGKDTITDGSQIIQLIDSEQKDDVEFTFADGTKKTLGAIRAEYRGLMATSRSNSFKAATTYLKATKEGDIDKSKLNAKILRSLAASGSDDVIMELFGKPYNFNMSNMVDKAEQIVLAHFSKGVLAQKVNGTKVSLVSDAGIQVVLDDKGNVIPYHVVDIDPAKYKNNKTRSLGHNLKDDKGNVYSECILSERVLTKHGLKIGDTIPEELLLSLGYRIPTQDKHSMMAFRIVGLMPNYMEGTGIFPYEIVYLSGADFDIDSEFIQLHDYWIKNPGKNQTYVKYGTETTIEDKWEAFKYYKTKRDKDFMADYKLRLKANGYQDISSEDENSAILKQSIKINAFAETAKEFNLPSNIKEFSKIKDAELLNNGVINNRILDNRIALLTNSEMLKEIAYTPSSTKGLSDIANEIDELKQKNSKYTVSENNRSTSDLNGKFASNLKNSAGKEGIGIVANMMQIFNFLAKSSSKLSENAFKYQIGGLVAKGYSFLGDAGGRISDTMSTILSVMTDNAKDPIAGQLNLNLNLLSGFTELIAQGLPKREAALVINQPIIQLYSQLRAVNSYKIKSRVEEGFTKKKTVAAAIAAFDTGKTSGPEFSKAYDAALVLGIEGYKSAITDVSTRMMEDAIAGNIDNPAMLREMQINLLIQFTEVEAQSDILSNISKLLKLNKGLSTSFSDLSVELKKAIEDLGLSPYFGLREQDIDEPTPIVDIIPALNADALTTGNVKKALRVLEIGSHLFISQTKTFQKAFDQTLDILNNSYKKKSKAIKSVSRQLLSYISTRGYINLLTKISNDPKSTKRVRDLYTKRLANINGTLIYKDLPGETLASMLINLQNSPDKLISDNPLIRYLQTEVSGNLDLVTSKTFAKESPETIAMLLDSYKSLYNMKETKDFAINMFNYLIVKDNLEFKNNTFVKYLAPFMFEKLSNSLDISMTELSKKDGGDVESVLGADMETVSYNFRKLFASYIGNRYSKLKYRELKGGAGYTIAGDDISFNVFQNLNADLMADRAAYIKEQENALIEKNQGIIKKDDKIDYSFEKFPEELKAGTTANRDAIDKIFDSKMINGRKYFIFPQFARWNNDTYELVRFDTYKGEQDHPFNESLHMGSSAIYTKVEVIGDKKVSQLSNETYDDALQLQKELAAVHSLAKEEFENSKNAIEDETDPEFIPEDNDEAQRMADANASNGAESLSFDDTTPKSKFPEADEFIEREYTPDNVTSLKPDEVFVFGSNSEGVHGKGAALLAKQKFGAIQGKAKGRQGQSYAIITKKNWRIEKSSTLDEIYQEVIDFNDYAKIHPENKFLVTKIGSSLAGYTISEIKQVWKDIQENYVIPNNVILPKEYEVRNYDNKLFKSNKKTILHRKIAGPVLYQEPEVDNKISVAEINRVLPGKFTARTKMFDNEIAKLNSQIGLLNNMNKRAGVNEVYSVHNVKSAGGTLFTYDVHKNIGTLNVAAKIARSTPEGGEASSVVEDLKTLMDNDESGQLDLFKAMEDTSIEDAKERKKECE